MKDCAAPEVEELNTQECKDALGKVVNDLRKGVLKGLPSMRRYCYGGDGAITGGPCCQNHGFTPETDRCAYLPRRSPTEGDYPACLAFQEAVRHTSGGRPSTQSPGKVIEVDGTHAR